MGEVDTTSFYTVLWKEMNEIYKLQKDAQVGFCCTNFATLTISYIENSSVKEFMYSNSLCVHDIACNFPCTPISLAKQSNPKEHCCPFQRGIGGPHR